MTYYQFHLSVYAKDSGYLICSVPLNNPVLYNLCAESFKEEDCIPVNEKIEKTLELYGYDIYTKHGDFYIERLEELE